MGHGEKSRFILAGSQIDSLIQGAMKPTVEKVQIGAGCFGKIMDGITLAEKEAKHGAFAVAQMGDAGLGENRADGGGQTVGSVGQRFIKTGFGENFKGGESGRGSQRIA